MKTKLDITLSAWLYSKGLMRTGNLVFRFGGWIQKLKHSYE